MIKNFYDSVPIAGPDSALLRIKIMFWHIGFIALVTSLFVGLSTFLWVIAGILATTWLWWISGVAIQSGLWEHIRD